MPFALCLGAQLDPADFARHGLRQSLAELDLADALGVVAGYLVADDVTARDFQNVRGQRFLGKSCDSFAPLGPALVTADEIAQVVARWSGIPVAKMLEGEREKLLHLEEELGDLLPWGVDVATGVEGDAHRKDPTRVAAFIEAVRKAESAG